MLENTIRWRKAIIANERKNGHRNLKARRSFNRFLGGGFEMLPDTSMFEILRDLNCKEIILTLDQQKRVPSLSSAQWDFLINAIPDEYGFAHLIRVDEITVNPTIVWYEYGRNVRQGPRGQYTLVPHFQGDRNVDVEKANKFYTKCLYAHLNKKYAKTRTRENMEKKWYNAIVSGNVVDVENFRYFVRNDILNNEAMYQLDMKSVTIPATVVEIRSRVFTHNELSTITIPRHVKYIGKRAFASNQLRKIIFEGTALEIIHDFAFDGNRLRKLVLPEGLREIGKFAFRANRLRKINFERVVLEKIQDHTFEMNFLRTLVLPEGLTEIGEFAFADNHLTSVVFPSTLQYIGAWAFHNNFHLRDVVLPAGCRVDSSAFLTDNSDYIDNNGYINDGEAEYITLTNITFMEN